MPYTNSEKGIPLEIDPKGSNRPQLAGLILPVIIPKPQDSLNAGDLHLIIKPSSLLLSKGSKFLYSAFISDSQGVSYRIPPGSITWSVIADNEDLNIGSISANGLFQTLRFGKAQIVANLEFNSANLAASSDIEVVDREQMARIYGQVTDSLQRPIPKVMIFIDKFENGVVTDSEGNYTIPHVPAGESLTITFTYRGTVVKILRDVVVESEETTGIDVILDAFHETGKISLRPDSYQTAGKVIFTVDGLSGPLSSDEFQRAKEFELLGVASIDPNLYLQLIENQTYDSAVIVVGSLLSPAAGGVNPLPQVEVEYLKRVNRQGAPVGTLKGEILWSGGVVYFQVEQGNNAISRQYTLEGVSNFPKILEKLQDFSGTSYAGRVIGHVDSFNQTISVLEISLCDVFFQSEGEIYYEPEFLENGSILMDISSLSDLPIPESDLFILLNVEDVSPYIYNILLSSPNRKFPGMVCGIKTNNPLSDEYLYPSIKISRIQISSDTDDYLLHKRGKIWVNEDNFFLFSPSYSLEGEKSYLLQNIEQFDGVCMSVEESAEKAYYCFISGEIQGIEGEEKIAGSVIISQCELIEPVIESDQAEDTPKPDGFVYYAIDREVPVGGRFLYQELDDGVIGTKLYELANLDLRDPDTADLLESWPGLIIQIRLNSSVTEDLSGKQTTPGPTRLLINYMQVLQAADPLLKVSGNVIYHSWENVLEMIATSPSLAEGTRRSFIMRKIPDNTLSMLLNHPDQFVPVSGIIQVLQKEQSSDVGPFVADALDLRTLINPD